MRRSCSYRCARRGPSKVGESFLLVGSSTLFSKRGGAGAPCKTMPQKMARDGMEWYPESRRDVQAGVNYCISLLLHFVERQVLNARATPGELWISLTISFSINRLIFVS